MFQNRMSAIACFSRLAQTIFFLVLLIVTSSVHAEDYCSRAIPAELNSTLRTYADVDKPLLVELEVPSAGLLSVDLVVSNTLSSDVGNGILSLECLPRLALEPIVVERSAGHQILSVSAGGAYVFRVDSVDRRRPLGELKLSSAFVAEVDHYNSYGEDEEELEIDGFRGPIGHYGEDEEELEIDGFRGPVSHYGEDEEELEIDGFRGPIGHYGEDELEIYGFRGPVGHYGEDEEELEIDGLVTPVVNRSLVSRLDQLCRLGEVDDHGDSLTCATLMIPGRTIVGEIGNAWRDDVDTFHFVVGGYPGVELSTVVIETQGTVDTAGALYDHVGQLLDVATDGGTDDNFRFVRSLRPGAYYLQIQGRAAAQGFYGLQINVRR